MTKSNHQNEHRWTLSIFSSLFAASSVKTIFAPIEKIKIFAQTEITNREYIHKTRTKSNNKNSYLNLIKVNFYKIKTKFIYKEGGLRAFWNGNFVNLTRYSIKQGLMLNIKEYFYLKSKFFT